MGGIVYKFWSLSVLVVVAACAKGNADGKITDAKYTSNGGRWEIQTGPAHITFAAKDSAKGEYQVSTTIEQLEKPKHPEAYGVFLGGTNLTDPAKQKYGYFVLRGTG